MDNPPPTLRPKPIGDGTPAGASLRAKKKFPTGKIIAGSIAAVAAAVIAVIGMYYQALRPVDTGDSSMQTVEIISGMTPADIADLLKESGVIRSETAFAIYTRIGGVRNQLQAGTYQLGKQQSTQAIVALLVKGPMNNEFEVTFLPGSTLADSKKALLAAGFSAAQVDEALAERYNHPLLAGRPVGADLEGYIFGETHRFVEGTPARTVLMRFFDDYYQVVEQEGLVEKYKAQGLSLYQGITLASIIQRESGGDDKAQIAQIFLLRLKRGIQLGSDVTYQYIADKEGNPRDVNYDSPYNTRRYAGLPPGPIATPGVAALTAAANPASGDYLYFLSGDDDVTYYGRTLAEHEANIRNHCQKKCQII